MSTLTVRYTRFHHIFKNILSYVTVSLACCSFFVTHTYVKQLLQIRIIIKRLEIFSDNNVHPFSLLSFNQQFTSFIYLQPYYIEPIRLVNNTITIYSLLVLFLYFTVQVTSRQNQNQLMTQVVTWCIGNVIITWQAGHNTLRMVSQPVRHSSSMDADRIEIGNWCERLNLCCCSNVLDFLIKVEKKLKFEARFFRYYRVEFSRFCCCSYYR